MKTLISILVIFFSSYLFAEVKIYEELPEGKWELRNNDYLICVNNKAKYSITRGWNIAKVSTTLSVISNGKIVSNKIINTVGRSSTSKQSAKQSASKSFIKKIKKEGINRIIF